MSRQQEHQSAELSKFSNNFIRPTKWKISDNVKIEEPNVLKVNKLWTFGLVKSEYPLEPTKSLFKVHLLDIENRRKRYTWIGLYPKAQTNKTPAGIVYVDTGTIGVNGDIVHYGPKWEVDDIIECGIKFPNNFINDGNDSVTIYLSRNEELVYELPLVKIPKDGLFPTIRLEGKDCTFRYCQ